MSKLPPPNKRVQRTRLRSPLTRHPLGGFWLLRGRAFAAAVIVPTLLCGCETFAGKLYWAGKAPGFLAKATCERSEPESGSLVQVKVRADEGGALPGVSIQFSRPGSGAKVQYVTDEHGTVNAWMDPGSWHVDALLPGFRSGRYQLELSKDQVCTIAFRLSIDSATALTVT